MTGFTLLPIASLLGGAGRPTVGIPPLEILLLLALVPVVGWIAEDPRRQWVRIIGTAVLLALVLAFGVAMARPSFGKQHPSEGAEPERVPSPVSGCRPDAASADSASGWPATART